MKNLYWFAALVILAARLLQAQTSPAAADPLAQFTPKQRAELLAGKPVFEYKTNAPDQAQSGQGRARIIVNSTADNCFKIFSDLEAQTQYFPHKTESKIVKNDGNTVWLQNRFFFYLAEVYYTSKYTIDPAKRRFEFELDKQYPHNLPESSGYFQFEQIDSDRTLFTYGVTKLDTGIPVPNLITKWLSSRDLPTEVVNVKKRIESGGKWKIGQP